MNVPGCWTIRSIDPTKAAHALRASQVVLRVGILLARDARGHGQPVGRFAQ